MKEKFERRLGDDAANPIADLVPNLRRLNARRLSSRLTRTGEAGEGQEYSVPGTKVVHFANTSVHFSTVMSTIGLEVQAYRTPSRSAIPLATEDVFGVEVLEVGRCLLVVQILYQRRPIRVRESTAVSVILSRRLIWLLNLCFRHLLPSPLATFPVLVPSSTSGHETRISGDRVE